MLFLGVDGGGTKTIAALVDENGNLIGLGFSGPCNILENGEEVVRKNLREAVAPFKETLRKHKEQVFSCFGLPAVGEFRNSQEIMGNILKQELVIEPNIVVNDVVVGWAAGTLTRDGVHVVAGTGAIIYGRKGNQEVRVSGWGSLIGDEGSAYDIGRMAINIVT
ncbi:MAG TPA: ATPase, partial [Petrotoga sp.]|nr:ATPase [Petrotoga sp.]